MSKVLVTGAGGYIGTTLVPMILRRGYRVISVDRFFFGRHLLPEHSRMEVLVEDVRRLERPHFSGVDAVIDLAAISNDPSGELFQGATWAINHRARVRCAELAKSAGVSRYILPSSCSVYGFQDPDHIATETSPTNPLTTYAKANLAAEADVLDLADDDFCVTVLRQATVYGYSPRMRFDLAINGMTYGAWKTGRLPLMRDGSQWRPMVHVADTSEAQIHVLETERALVNGEIFNVGSAENVYQIGPLGEIVAGDVPGDIDIEWYGDPDHRSYRVGFDKIEDIGWSARRQAGDGVREIVAALGAGQTDRTPETITLEWYKTLYRFHDILNQVELNGELFEVPGRSG
jgi:nucleoside-diphosphate-sugar epimerase